MGAMESKHSSRLPRLESLETLSLQELQALYTQLLNTLPPKRASRNFLEGNIAWAIQAVRTDKNPVVHRKKLIEVSSRTKLLDASPYKPGTRLIREWHGTVYEVIILDKGYFWNNRTYKSLSAISREITGANCSGPVFFGLKKRK